MGASTEELCTSENPEELGLKAMENLGGCEGRKKFEEEKNLECFITKLKGELSGNNSKNNFGNEA